MKIASTPDRNRRDLRLRVLVGVMCLGVACTSVRAQTPARQTPALREGLIVAPAERVAYVMTLEGGVAAIDLATGAVRWTSREAAKPLTLAGNLLVSQAEPKTSANRLELVTLNARESGRVAARGRTDLPPGVRASVGENLEGRFSAAASPANGAAVVTWSFAPTPMRGMPTTDDDPRPATGERRSAVPRTEGTVRMNLATGAMSRVDARAAAPQPQPPRSIVAPAQRVAGAPLTQYESADGRHVLATERVDDDRVWDKYRWTVYERATGKRIGELRTHVSFAPFVLSDSVLVYETTPYVREGREEPAKLRGVSLETGKEIWSTPVREVVWRGTLPP